MTHFRHNPPPQWVLIFHKALTHAKNSDMLILGWPCPVVCLHYETKANTVNKKYTYNTTLMKAAKFTIALLSLITLTVGFSTVSLANDEGKKTPVTELKFIGNVSNQPVFELNLANAEEDEIVVTFRDEAGNVIFNDKFKGININKKFMLKSEDLSDAVLNVTVRSVKKNTTEVYAINRSQSYVEETVVNKLK
jgi:hypothetical protein